MYPPAVVESLFLWVSSHDFLDFRVLEALAMGPDRKKALLVRPDLGLPSLRATTHTGMEWLPI